MYKRKLHKEISSGLLALIVAFSLTGCGRRNQSGNRYSHSSHLTDNPGDDNGT